MAEVVAYEDSPLAQYLQEIEATEKPVSDDNPYETRKISKIADLKDATGTEAGGPWKLFVTRLICETRINITKLLTRILGPSEKESLAGVATAVWDLVVNTIALSGHLAERYTPKPTRRYENPTGLTCWNNGLPMRSLAGVSAGGLFFTIMLGHPLVANKPIVGALVAGTTAFTAIIIERNHGRITKSKRVVELFINNVKELSARSRTLDIATQKAMRFIQEVVFVSRGFRAPQYIGLRGISSRPGRGTLWAAANLQQIGTNSLVRCIQALFGTLDSIATSVGKCEDGGLIERCDCAAVSELKSEFAILKESMSDECNQIEQLQRLFELHFATRRIWLESILATMEPVCKAESVDRDIFLSILSETSTDIERMLAVIIGSIDEITSAREAQFTAKRWEALSESKDGSDALTTSSQPVVRCLTSMNSTIDTISAKLVVCRDTIELPGEEGTSGAQEVVPFNEVARVFASLKTDIDVLAGLYQEAMTSLTLDIDGPGSTEAVTLDQGKDHAQYTATDGIIDMSTIPDGAQVFGCTPFGTDDMDTSDLVFEADPSDEPLDRRQQRPAADRAERIGLQKQKREKEAQERRKAGEVHSMMNELRTAIGTRGKQKEATSD